MLIMIGYCLSLQLKPSKYTFIRLAQDVITLLGVRATANSGFPSGESLVELKAVFTFYLI